MERGFHHAATCYGVTLRLGAAPPACDDFPVLSRPGATAGCSSSACPRASFRTRTTTTSLQTEAAQGTSYYQMVKYQKRLPISCVQDPDVDSFSSSAGGGSRRRPQHRPHDRQTEAARRAKRHRESMIEQLRPQAVATFPGMRVYLHHSAGHPHRRAMSKGLYEYTLQGPDTRELYQEAPKLERNMPRCRDCRMSPAICRSRPRRSPSRSTATRPPLWR